MANSKYEYVREFETFEAVLPMTFMVVRLDGQNFTKFSADHGFEKPNDIKALELMNFCAQRIMSKVSDIIFSYGQSDEYSFVFSKKSKYFMRRVSKITSVICGQFSSSYTFYWKQYFPSVELKYPPAFDARIVVYPSEKILKDYLKWRQVDCHINNLYNTCFWSLVNSGTGKKEAEKILAGTLSSDKNELLFSKFQINYNNIPQIFRKGTILIRQDQVVEQVGPEGDTIIRTKKRVEPLHVDIIGEKFWDENAELLNR